MKYFGNPAFSGKFNNNLPLWVTASVTALALLIQMQINLFETNAYRGIRLYVSDLIIPVLGLAILWSLVTRRSCWPKWRLRGLYWWFFILTVVLTVALLNGYLDSGQLSRWALFNKYIGWFVLLAYAGLGGWLTSNYGRAAVDLFLKVYYTSFVIALCAFAGRDLFQIFLLDKYVFAIEGLLKNRNAYAFLVLSTTALLTTIVLNPVSGEKKNSQLFLWLTRTVWFLLPFFAYLNASRAGTLVGLILFFIYVAWGRTTFLKQAGLYFLVGAIALTALLASTDQPFFRQNQFETTLAAYETEVQGSDSQAVKLGLSERVRIRVLQDAFELWRGHKFLGAGLGSFLSYSADKYKGDDTVDIDIIDFTLLWLLTETGLVGAGLFLIFFCLSLVCLWRCGYRHSGYESGFCYGILMVLVTFGLMSVLHELLYTRYLWLFMGMGLARFNQPNAHVPANGQTC